MDEKKVFNVVLVGGIKEGFEESTVKNNLATLFKLPLEKAEGLLKGRSLVVKGSVDTATAAEYKVAIERAGAYCTLEAVPQEPHFEFDFNTNESVNLNSAAIWNPSSAANWSLLFSPVFGTYLHALNWRALNEKERYDKAMIWFYVGIAVLFLSVVSVFIKKGGGGGGSFLFLLIWYFTAGKSQAKYVKEKFGNNYPRRAWGKPLAFACVALLVYVIVGVLVLK
jgi:hypothetical protein